MTLLNRLLLMVLGGRRAPAFVRRDELDPLPYFAEWPSLRSAWGRVDIHSLAAFWIHESQVRGDYYEFGVASGRSAVCAVRASRLYGEPAAAHFHLFDSFEGLPELTGVDAGSDQFSKGDFEFRQEQARQTMERHGAWNPARTTFYAGWFEHTLTRELQAHLSSRPAAIIHIDCDLYASARTVLTFVTPLLQRGTILLVDDYNCFQGSGTRGLRLALNEWTRQSGVPLVLHPYASYGWHGSAFIVDMPSATQSEVR
jgi:O-methyltransferase